ncbi:SIMPL domain-containing protein [Noviherbaspirillum sp.]|uniref:SIMPL domain-containing protein n=1 Tax=Noviherbaspirillum sp. TaxID=1926288 RepID=UPI002D26E807|nr:SIMPL domain-containing protein [Noviherbaspirillum sp.]HZW22764.1 SIMPL domain-containing protein [Noviherbaspirillum sp.]
MARFLAGLMIAAALGGTAAAHAQTTAQNGGTLVILPAYGEVRQANDEARATLMIEEQDKDKATAASRVNLKMKQGTEIVRKEDPQAVLKTRGYYTYPVYNEEPVQPRQGNRNRQPVGWRVGQYLEITTPNLAGLPKTIAAAQRILALNSLHFGLTEATSRKLEEQRIAAAYRNLTDRLAAVAKAMGRNPSDAVLETVDFEASGAYAQDAAPAAKAMRGAPMEAMQVEEPSFEPGETTLGTRVVGKVRFR